MPSRSGVDRGFTLIEMLVVLVVISLIAGVALPGLQRVARSVEISSQREALLTEIGGLGYRAYVTGAPIVLSGPRRGAQGVPAYPFAVPEDWQLEIPEPIRYGFNGICSGGSVILVNPDQRREELRLEPPLCKVTGAAASK